MIDVIGVNPTPIGIFTNTKHQQDKQKLLNYTKAKASRTGSNGVKHFYNNHCMLTAHSDLHGLKSWLIDCALKFSTQVLGYKVSDLFVAGSWLNLTQSGGFQPKHLHENSLVSGTYYVQRNDDHAPIIFYNGAELTTPPHPILTPPKKETPYNSHSLINPKEGDLLLWSSELLHGYPSSNAGRVSLSMNFLPTAIDTLYGCKLAPIYI